MAEAVFEVAENPIVHPIGSNPHKFENWPAPSVTRAGVEYLARPWGERAVQTFYNRLEERYPIIDNFALAGAGLKYGLAADGLANAGEAAPQLLRYLLSLMSWQQFSPMFPFVLVASSPFTISSFVCLRHVSNLPTIALARVYAAAARSDMVRR